jgi:hypothetical protein
MYPEDCIALDAKGRKEVRILKSLGNDFAVYGYRDVETEKDLSKYSILLKKKSELEHLIIIPIRSGKELVVKHETEKYEKRGIYDLKKKETVYF